MSADKLLKMALEKHQCGNFPEAIKLYGKILAKIPRHLDANYLLGTLYAELGEYEKGAQYLLKASAINPNSPQVHVNLGHLYRKLGAPDLAAKYFTRAKQLSPRMYEAHLGLGSALLELNEDFDKVAACLQKAQALAPNVPETYHQMGMLYAKKGNPDEAVKLLETARAMNPGFPNINWDLGLICLKKGDLEAAGEYFRASCAVSPNHAESAFFLDVVEGRPPAPELTKRYAQVLFDEYAPKFEKHLVEKLQYSLPSKVATKVKELCGDDCRFDSVVDLGCGTGLTGEALRACANKLTGIDISEKMIGIAKEKKCFDRLYCGDLAAVLDREKETYDLLVASDVLIYVGDLDPVMPSLVARSRPGALFVFSTERSEDEGVSLRKTGRFAHNSQYIHEVMKKYGCEVLSEEPIQLRLEGEEWIPGSLFAVRVLKS